MPRSSRTALPLLLLATIASAAFDCSSPIQLNDDRFDLASLKGQHHFESSVNTPPTVTKTTYDLSICAPLPDTGDGLDDCPASTRLCLKTFSTRSGLEDRLVSVVQVASFDQDPTARLLMDEKTTDKGWVLQMGGGKWNDVEQRVEVEMVCDTEGKETTPTLKAFDSKLGLLSLKWITSAACPLDSSSPQPSPPPSSPPDSSSGGSMGFFGYFFTFILLAFVVYFVGGAWHNYTQYGATGWDAVPHRDMWRDLPYVVSDLFKGRGGSRNGYSALG